MEGELLGFNKPDVLRAPNQLCYLVCVTCPFPASRLPGCSLWRTPVTIITHTCASSDSPGLHHFPDYLQEQLQALIPETERQAPLPPPVRQALMPQPDRQTPLLQPARRAFMPSPGRQAPLLPPALQWLASCGWSRTNRGGGTITYALSGTLGRHAPGTQPD